MNYSQSKTKQWGEVQEYASKAVEMSNTLGCSEDVERASAIINNLCGKSDVGDIVGTTLSTWCQMEGLNKFDVFQALYKEGYLDFADNSVTVKLVEDFWDVDMDKFDAGETEISVSKNMVLLNTYISSYSALVALWGLH